MIRNKSLLSICMFFIVFCFSETGNTEVTPEIQLGGRGVISLNINNSPDGDSENVADFSDTSLLLGLRQKLYNSYRGQFVLGFQLPDRDSTLDSPFFHQVFLKIENRVNILKLGRTRLRSSLIEFPTMRDDDAIHFTDSLNPFITGENSEENQYGELLEVSRIFGQRYRANLYGGHVKEDTVITGDDEEDLRFNTLGLILQYRVPETQRWNRELLDQIGIGFNTFFTDRPGYSGFDKNIKNVFFSAVINVYPDPVHFWDVRHQTIYNSGFSELDNVTDFTSMTKAESISLFTSLRYLYRKLEGPTLQAAVSYGYKDFPDLANSSAQHQFVANGFYRIGENFDVGLQLQYLNNKGQLEDLLPSHETRMQLAIVYNVELLFNRQFDDRESLLNLEHGYIP